MSEDLLRRFAAETERRARDRGPCCSGRGAGGGHQQSRRRGGVAGTAVQFLAIWLSTLACRDGQALMPNTIAQLDLCALADAIAAGDITSVATSTVALERLDTRRSQAQRRGPARSGSRAASR